MHWCLSCVIRYWTLNDKNNARIIYDAFGSSHADVCRHWRIQTFGFGFTSCASQWASGGSRDFSVPAQNHEQRKKTFKYLMGFILALTYKIIIIIISMLIMISVCIGTSDGLSNACNTYSTSFDSSIVSLIIIFYYYKQYVSWIGGAAAALCILCGDCAHCSIRFHMIKYGLRLPIKKIVRRKWDLNTKYLTHALTLRPIILMWRWCAGHHTDSADSICAVIVCVCVCASVPILD